MKKVPTLRFKDFTDDWVEKEVREFTTEYKRPILNPKKDYCRLGIRSHAKGTFHEKVLAGQGLDVKNLYVVGANNLIVNITFAWEHAIAITDEKDEGKLVSHRFPQFSFNSGFVPLFFKYSILDKDFKYKLELASPGGAGRNRVLNLNLFNHIIRNVPVSEKEQTKIGLFLSKLDNLISEQEKKCKKLSAIKKSLLSLMFPKKTENVPKLRFKEFAEEWAEGTIEHYGYFYYGRSCPKWSVSNKAKTPCIRYGEMYTKFGEKIESVLSHTNMPADKLRFSNGNEVLVPRVGEDPFDYTHCTWLSIPHVAIGEMISVYNTNQNPLFTAIMFNATLRYDFARRVEGFTVTNLYYEKLKEIVVKFPKREEQERISNFIMKLEDLKKLENKKYEKLLQIKKAFLQKMYV